MNAPMEPHRTGSTTYPPCQTSRQLGCEPGVPGGCGLPRQTGPRGAARASPPALGRVGLACAIVLSLSGALPACGGIPARPEKLKFPPLAYEPPDPVAYRVQLASGPVAYVVPDKELPLVNVLVLVRTGEYLDPPGKEGLAELTGYLLTRAGTASRSAEQLEERLDFLAAQLDSSISEAEGRVSLNLLSKDLDEGLALLREVLSAPRFQEDRLALRRQQVLQQMKRRNDDSADIEARERRFLGLGEHFWAARLSTEASINAIQRDDLTNFHRQWFHPSNFVVAASGDFDRAAMIARLEKLFANWPFPGRPAPPVPTNIQFAPPGIYLVHKDVPQGRVSLLLPGLMRDHPDQFPVLVMNHILGGGGFTSRMMNRVRSDEGLAYAVGSRFVGGIYYPLPFVASFQTKSRTVAWATSIIIDELKHMAAEPVSPQERQTAQQAFIETFPRNFATKAQVANTFAQDEFTGRYAKDPDYWKQYRSRIRAVTAADVQRVARTYLNLDKLVILVVGNKPEILKGHPDHAVSLEGLANGRLFDRPLRDPMTLRPLP